MPLYQLSICTKGLTLVVMEIMGMLFLWKTGHSIDIEGFIFTLYGYSQDLYLFVVWIK